MKIVLATFGSRGDVQPMLALTLALKSAGHDVLFAGPPEKAMWAAQLGAPFHPLGSDLTAFLDSIKSAYSFGATLCFIRFMRRELGGQFDALPKIIAGADLVIGASLVLALSSAAEAMGVAYRYIAFTPQLLPSGDHPFVAVKHHGLPRWCNRLTWETARLLDRINLNRMINQKRRQLGLSPTKDAWDHILGRHVIVASDRAISGVPLDIGRRHSQTGYMHLDQPDQHHPGLEAFLNAGPSPVYAGFGSMPKQDQIDSLPVVIQAARSAGQRVVVGKFWEEPSVYDDAEDVFFIKRYPHLKLFPRMAAIVHHGGAGTTATSAASGVPQIIVPHILDQYYWGDQVCRSGLGPKPIWRSRLTARKLAAAIKECLSNHAMRQQAEGASAMIGKADSVETAVRAVLKGRGETR
jgi:UDP:flavonoid glycosyltransferase YjiC (YdhE family)